MQSLSAWRVHTFAAASCAKSSCEKKRGIGLTCVARWMELVLCSLPSSVGSGTSYALWLAEPKRNRWAMPRTGLDIESAQTRLRSQSSESV